MIRLLVLGMFALWQVGAADAEVNCERVVIDDEVFLRICGILEGQNELPAGFVATVCFPVRIVGIPKEEVGMLRYGVAMYIADAEIHELEIAEEYATTDSTTMYRWLDITAAIKESNDGNIEIDAIIGDLREWNESIDFILDDNNKGKISCPIINIWGGTNSKGRQNRVDAVATNTPKIVCTPNPFRIATTIDTGSDKDLNVNGQVCIYDIRGRLVKKICLPQRAGSVTWDGKDTRDIDMPSGVYLVTVTRDGVSSEYSGRIMLIR